MPALILNLNRTNNNVCFDYFRYVLLLHLIQGKFSSVYHCYHTVLCRNVLNQCITGNVGIKQNTVCHWSISPLSTWLVIFRGKVTQVHYKYSCAQDMDIGIVRYILNGSMTRTLAKTPLNFTYRLAGSLIINCLSCSPKWLA